MKKRVMKCLAAGFAAILICFTIFAAMPADAYAQGWYRGYNPYYGSYLDLMYDFQNYRVVTVTGDESEYGYYQALWGYHFYVTNDSNLDVSYTLDGYIIGSVVNGNDVSEDVNIVVSVNDPDEENISYVEVFSNGGTSVVKEEINSASGNVSFSVPADCSGYYVVVGEEDGDVAITAPIWITKKDHSTEEDCGIKDVSSNNIELTEGDTREISIDFYNNEDSDFVISEISVEAVGEDNVTVNVGVFNGENLDNGGVINHNESRTFILDCTNELVGRVTYHVCVKGSINGIEKDYSGEVSIVYEMPKEEEEIERGPIIGNLPQTEEQPSVPATPAKEEPVYDNTQDTDINRDTNTSENTDDDKISEENKTESVAETLQESTPLTTPVTSNTTVHEENTLPKMEEEKVEEQEIVEIEEKPAPVSAPELKVSANEGLDVGISTEEMDKIHNDINTLLEILKEDGDFGNMISPDTAKKLKQAVLEGKNISTDISVAVTSPELFAGEDKADIENTLKEHLGDNDGAILQYVNIEIGILADGENIGSLNELSEEIEIELDLKEIVTDAEYFIIRNHNGEISVLDVTRKDGNILTLKSGKFSTYALGYRIIGYNDVPLASKPVKKSVWIWSVAGASAIAFVAVYIVLKKKKVEEEEA